MHRHRIQGLRLLAALMLWATTSLAGALEIHEAQEYELDGLKGLGPAQTRRIMAERARQAFADWTDLRQRVKGLGVRRCQELSRQGLTVNGVAFTDPASDTDLSAQPTAATLPRADTDSGSR